MFDVDLMFTYNKVAQAYGYSNRRDHFGAFADESTARDAAYDQARVWNQYKPYPLDYVEVRAEGHPLARYKWFARGKEVREVPLKPVRTPRAKKVKVPTETVTAAEPSDPVAASSPALSIVE